MSTSGVFKLLMVISASALALFGCEQSTGGSGDTSAPGEVSNLVANAGDGRVELRWNDPADNDFTGVQLTWSPELGENQPKTVSAGTEKATVIVLENGFEYSFTVRTMDTAGNLSSGISMSARAVDFSALFAPESAGLAPMKRASSSVGDVNGDDHTDLVITGGDSGNSPTSTVYTNDGTGFFTDASAGLTGVRGTNSIGDVNGDDAQDLVIAGYDGSNPTATLYTNDGSGGFSSAAVGLTEVSADSSSSFGDVDGDGHLDLVLTGSDTNSYHTATLYTNDGSGGFSNAPVGLTGVGADSSSSFGDVDGDGDLDLVITGDDGTSRTATLYENDGNGDFAEVSAGLTGVIQGSSSFLDADGDGDLDLVITGWDGNGPTATLYENDGSGDFSESSAGLAGARWSSMSFGDVDGDGDPDLVITGWNGSRETATLYINDGEGNFSDASVGLTGVEHGSSSFLDADGDGDLDLVVMGDDRSDTATATLYKNQLY